MSRKSSRIPRFLSDLLPARSGGEPEGRREERDEAFYRAGTVVAAAYVLFGVVLNYDLNFTDIEWSYLWLPLIYRRGLGFALNDLRQAFALLVLEGSGRVSGRGRYISWLCVALNAKVRILLAQVIPPHPSFSFTWIFNVVLAPIMLFKVMERLSGKRSTAWACVALYLMSPGFLSGITFLMLLGKPLAHFGLICALLFATRPQHGGRGPDAHTARRWVALALTLFVSCFFDDTAWFSAVAVTVLFFAGIPRNWKQVLPVVGYFAPLCLFLALLGVPIPGAPHTSIWRSAILENDVLRSGSFDFALNSYYLLGSHFLPYSILNAALPWAPALFLAAFGVTLWLWGRGVEKAQKNLLLRTGLLLAAYLMFHSLVMTAHPVVVSIFHCCFYYGTLTSLFLAMLFAVLLTAQKSPRGRVAAKVFFAVWIISLSVNFGDMDRSWKRIGVTSSLTDLSDFPSGHGRDDASGPSFREVLRAWRARKDPAELLRLRREYPQSAYWLFNELDYVAAPNAAEFAQVRLRVPGQLILNQGIQAASQGQTDAGLALALASISVDPRNPAANLEAGFLYDLKGDVDHAIEQGQAAVALDPNMVDARNNLGWALFQKGRYRESVAQFQEALKRAPGNQLAANNLAAALSRLPPHK